MRTFARGEIHDRRFQIFFLDVDGARRPHLRRELQPLRENIGNQHFSAFGERDLHNRQPCRAGTKDNDLVALANLRPCIDLGAHRIRLNQTGHRLAQFRLVQLVHHLAADFEILSKTAIAVHTRDFQILANVMMPGAAGITMTTAINNID